MPNTNDKGEPLLISIVPYFMLVRVVETNALPHLPLSYIALFRGVTRPNKRAFWNMDAKVDTHSRIGGTMMRPYFGPWLQHREFTGASNH
mmetsp:Transcript_62845/g.178686  ORF Transcript_62845/g.178686 Transcript_62845/m.178686 type:complete len:90 (+) Transcript_62845:2-271(+)